MYAQIATKVPHLLTYKVPDDLKNQIKVGQAVKIPLGQRTAEGIVISFTEKTNIKGIKEIKKIINPEPILDEKQLGLAFWMSEYYYASLFKCLKFFFPPAKSKSLLKVQKIKKGTNQKPTLLFYSEKAEKEKKYIEKIKKAILKDKQVLILFPQINERNDFILKILLKYPKISALFESGLSQKQRGEIWQKVREGKTKIIIGSQMPLFLPLANLGLIIVDEEENRNYKQDQGPFYNSRDIALKLAEIYGAEIILGSNSPSIESFYKAKNNNYKLEENKQKLNYQIDFVDLEKLDFEEKLLSPKLKENLAKILSQNKKAVSGGAILFLNRKGMARSIVCPDCGESIVCPKCDLPLIYHQSENNLNPTPFLSCSRCGYKTGAPDTCPKCLSLFIRESGAGTQRLEKDLLKIYPLQKIGRIDKDVPSEILKKTLGDFEKGKIKILVATEYILNFSVFRADLLGIISADSEFNFPNFRSGERIFETLTKLKTLLKKNGKIIIQTHNPGHPAMSLNFNNFYKNEIKERKSLYYPPFTDLIKLTYKNRSLEKCFEESEKMAEELRNQNLDFLGPSPAFIPRTKGTYKFKILLKIPLKTSLNERNKLLSSIPSDWSIDVDPQDML